MATLNKVADKKYHQNAGSFFAKLGQESIQNERLTVPHVGIIERDFVVIPLLDLDAEMQLKGQVLKSLPFLEHPTVTVLDNEAWAH